MDTHFFKTMRGFALILAATMLVAACQPKTSAAPPPTATLPPAATPTSSVTSAVNVNDQAIVNGAVTVAEVDSAGPGWMVIHNQVNGQPGAVIGYTAVQPGVNMNVVVQIDVTKATPVLYAMLHIDAGTVGKYEFPGADVPAVVNGKPVTPPFNVTGGLPTAAASSAPAIILTPTPSNSSSGSSGGGYSY